MELIQCTPWVRFADDLRFTYQRDPSKTYDCRLLYAKSGKAELEMDAHAYALVPGSLVIFQPGTHYCIRPKETINLTVLDFDFTQDYSQQIAFLPPCPAEKFQPELAHAQVDFSDAPELNSPLFMEKADFVSAGLGSIVSEFRDRQSLFRGRASTLFKDILFQTVRACRTGSEPQDVMSKVRRYIIAHPDRRISNQELGNALNYNPNYLNRLVLSSTGMSLHQYVLQCRLAQATKELAAGKHSVQEIAAALGFHSASHFANFFKHATGMTPAEFRKHPIL